MFIFQVDMSKVNLETIKPWINQKVTDMFGLEDDVIVEYAYNQLEDRVRLRVVCTVQCVQSIIEK